MKLKRLSWLAALGALPVLASEGAHSDPAAPVVLWLAVILVVAKVGGHLAVRLSQPAVLGELLAGRDRQVAGPTAPASGLTFVGPRYEAHWGLPLEVSQ